MAFANTSSVHIYACTQTTDMGDLYVEIGMFAGKKGETYTSERNNDEGDLEWRGVCTFSLANHRDAAGDEKVTESIYDNVFPIVTTPTTGADASSVTVVGGLALKFSTVFSTSSLPNSNELADTSAGHSDASQEDEKIQVEPEVSRAHRSSFELNEHRSEHDADLPLFPALDAGRTTTPARAVQKNADPSRDATTSSKSQCNEDKDEDEAKASTSSSSLRRSIVGLKKRNNHKGRKMHSQRNAQIADATAAAPTTTPVKSVNGGAGGASANKSPASVFKPKVARSSPSSTHGGHEIPLPSPEAMRNGSAAHQHIDDEDVASANVITQADIAHEEAFASILAAVDASDGTGDPIDILLVRAHRLRHAMTEAIVNTKTSISLEADVNSTEMVHDDTTGGHTNLDDDDDDVMLRGVSTDDGVGATNGGRTKAKSTAPDVRSNTTLVGTTAGIVVDIGSVAEEEAEFRKSLEELATSAPQPSSFSTLAVAFQEAGDVLPNAVSVSTNNADEYGRFSVNDVADDALIEELFFDSATGKGGNENDVSCLRRGMPTAASGTSVIVRRSSFAHAPPNEPEVNLLIRMPVRVSSSSVTSSSSPQASCAFTLKGGSGCGDVWFDNSWRAAAAADGMDTESEIHTPLTSEAQIPLIIEVWRNAFLGIVKADVNIDTLGLNALTARSFANRCEVFDVLANRVVGWVDLLVSACGKDEHEKHVAATTLQQWWRFRGKTNTEKEDGSRKTNDRVVGAARRHVSGDAGSVKAVSQETTSRTIKQNGVAEAKHTSETSEPEPMDIDEVPLRGRGGAHENAAGPSLVGDITSSRPNPYATQDRRIQSGVEHHTFDVTILSARGSCLLDCGGAAHSAVSGGTYFYVRYCFPGEDEPLYTKVAHPAFQNNIDPSGDGDAAFGATVVGTLSLSARARHVISLPMFAGPSHADESGSAGADANARALLDADLTFELWSAHDDKYGTDGRLSSGGGGNEGCSPTSNEHTLVAAARVSVADVMKHRQQHLWLTLTKRGVRCGELLIQAVYSCDVPVFSMMMPQDRDEFRTAASVREHQHDSAAVLPQSAPTTFPSAGAPADFATSIGRPAHGGEIEIETTEDAKITRSTGGVHESSSNAADDDRRGEEPRDHDTVVDEQVTEAVSIIEALNDIAIDTRKFTGIDSLIDDSGDLAQADTKPESPTPPPPPPPAVDNVMERDDDHPSSSSSSAHQSHLQSAVFDVQDDFMQTTATIQSITAELEDLVNQINGRKQRDDAAASVAVVTVDDDKNAAHDELPGGEDRGATSGAATQRAEGGQLLAEAKNVSLLREDETVIEAEERFLSSLTDCDNGDKSDDTTDLGADAVEGTRSDGTHASAPVSDTERPIASTSTFDDREKDEGDNAQVITRIHAVVAHTPMPIKVGELPRDETEKRAVEGESTSTTSPSALLQHTDVTKSEESSTLAKAGVREGFHMSEFRRQLLEKETERITKIMGRRVDTAQLLLPTHS